MEFFHAFLFAGVKPPGLAANASAKRGCFTQGCAKKRFWPYNWRLKQVFFHRANSLRPGRKAFSACSYSRFLHHANLLFCSRGFDKYTAKAYNKYCNYSLFQGGVQVPTGGDVRGAQSPRAACWRLMRCESSTDGIVRMEETGTVL